MQRTDEWIEKDNKEYHARQFLTPYRSTVAFCDWLEEIGYIERDSSLSIIDIGAGQGANLLYMGRRYPKCRFVGLDINEENISVGNQVLARAEMKNCSLVVGDIYNLDKKYISCFDAVVSFQTLSWLPGYEEPLNSLVDLRAKWIALTSLFYDGEVSCDISVKQYDESLNSNLDINYNVYSLPVVEKHFSERGYQNFQACEFEIDIDLPAPQSKYMSTYTEKLVSGKRLQISGPLLMPWHFISCQRDG